MAEAGLRVPAEPAPPGNRTLGHLEDTWGSRERVLLELGVGTPSGAQGRLAQGLAP